MKHFLEADSIQKSYNNKTILSDVYLKCETGDIIGVLGRNGTGKSTLLKIIFGTEAADNKFIRVDTKVRKRAFLYKSDISYLPQDNFVPKHFRVSKAIQLFIEKASISEFKNDDDIQKIYTKKINQLSGGELRYLEIMLILFKRSKFVLLDEPFNGISPLMIEKVLAQIKKHGIGKGIILTDHSYRNVINVANQLYLIKECALKKLKNKEELVFHGYLKDGML